MSQSFSYKSYPKYILSNSQKTMMFWIFRGLCHVRISVQLLLEGMGSSFSQHIVTLCIRFLQRNRTNRLAYPQMYMMLCPYVLKLGNSRRYYLHLVSFSCVSMKHNILSQLLAPDLFHATVLNHTLFLLFLLPLFMFAGIKSHYSFSYVSFSSDFLENFSHSLF